MKSLSHNVIFLAALISAAGLLVAGGCAASGDRASRPGESERASIESRQVTADARVNQDGVQPATTAYLISRRTPNDTWVDKSGNERPTGQPAVWHLGVFPPNGSPAGQAQMQAQLLMYLSSPPSVKDAAAIESGYAFATPAIGTNFASRAPVRTTRVIGIKPSDITIPAESVQAEDGSLKAIYPSKVLTYSTADADYVFATCIKSPGKEVVIEYNEGDSKVVISQGYYCVYQRDSSTGQWKWSAEMKIPSSADTAQNTVNDLLRHVKTKTGVSFFSDAPCN